MTKIITKKTITKIADEIEKREDFRLTINKTKDKEFLHTYNAYTLFDVIIVLCEYWDSHETQRQFLIYSNNKLREATGLEDDMLRGGDNETALRDFEDDEHHIIHRDNMNKITRGDK